MFSITSQRKNFYTYLFRICVSYLFFPQLSSAKVVLLFSRLFTPGFLAEDYLEDQAVYWIFFFFRFENDIWINMRDYLQKRFQSLLIWAHLANSCRAHFYLNFARDMSSGFAVSSATYFIFSLSKGSCLQYQTSQSDTIIMNIFPINQHQGGLHLRFIYREWLWEYNAIMHDELMEYVRYSHILQAFLVKTPNFRLQWECFFFLSVSLSIFDSLSPSLYN